MRKLKTRSPRYKKLISRIAQNVFNLRETKKWTQEYTAERLGCDLRWYQRIESGKHGITLETICRLSVLFGINEAYFLKDEGDSSF